VTEIEAQGLSHAPRTSRQTLDHRDAPMTPHEIDADVRLERANENGVRHSGSSGDEIEAMVHSVREVDVGVTRLAEHHRVARGLATERMTGRIFRSTVSLDLDDSSSDPPAGGIMNQHPPQEIARHPSDGPVVERARKRAPEDDRRLLGRRFGRDRRFQ